MFKIYRFIYKDKKTKSRWEFYARKKETADELATLVNELGVFNLAPAKIFFQRKMVTEMPPYELEQEQFETLEQYKQYKKEHEQK